MIYITKEEENWILDNLGFNRSSEVIVYDNHNLVILAEEKVRFLYDYDKYHNKYIICKRKEKLDQLLNVDI